MTTCYLRLSANRIHSAWRTASPESKPALQAQLRAVLAELATRNEARKARWARSL